MGSLTMMTTVSSIPRMSRSSSSSKLRDKQDISGIPNLKEKRRTEEKCMSYQPSDPSMQHASVSEPVAIREIITYTVLRVVPFTFFACHWYDNMD